MNESIHQSPRLTLHSIKLRVLSVPLRRPIVSNPSVGKYTEWPFILVDLLTNEGVTGRSYLEPYVARSANYLLPAIQAIADALQGKPLAPLDCYKTAMQTMHLSGREGIGLAATSALDMAVWDAVAKAAGQPLARYLGASTGPVRAYNTNGLWLLPAAQLGDEALSLVAEGNFSAIKMRLGRENLRADMAAIDAVRTAVGPDVRLMTDFNQALDLGEALLRLHALDGEGLQWFEEPIVYDNFEGCAQLARELKTPIQIGENIYGPRSFYNAVQARAADLYMPDLMRIGGVTGFMRCAAIAGAAGIPLSSHLYPEVSAHLLRASESTHWLEWRDWAHPFVAEPFEVKDGAVHVPDRPGSGLEWDEAAVKKLLIHSV
ncbi:MAG: mandelate racemase [Bdellovibrionales bacterium]|nr:mandelate racemase [Ramlibacter sp.]